MAIDDPARTHLHEQLRDVIGERAADTLMEEMGSLGREQLATRADVLGIRSEMAELRADLRTEMAELRADLGTEMAELRADVTSDVAELRADFGELRGEFGELRGEFGELRGEFGLLEGKFGELRAEFAGLRTEVADRLERTTRTLVVAFVGSMAAIATVVNAINGSG